jgi:preprotein translocase subunit YajC
MNIILIAIIVAMYWLASKDDQSFFRKYEFHMGSVRAGEQIRLVSSGFLRTLT